MVNELDNEMFIHALAVTKTEDPRSIAAKALESLEMKPLPDPKTKRLIEELKSMPSRPHDDQQDARALVPPPTAGILGAAAAILNPKLKEAHVEIPREPDIFKPTESVLDIFSEQNRSNVEKYLDKFGEQNGYPVIFVTTFRQFDPPKEDIVHEAFINTEVNIQMFKKSEMHDALNFARRNGGELGIFKHWDD